jgi:hypothetical protein
LIRLASPGIHVTTMIDLRLRGIPAEDGKCQQS